MSRLNDLQTKIIHVVTERQAEYELLHRRVKGLHNSHRFVTALNSRWRQLDTLVTAYNKEVRALDLQDVHPLDAKALKEDGLDNSEIWDVDTAMCKSDWAAHPSVREGIEAVFLLQRAKEEDHRLPLHCQRLTAWLNHQVPVLLRLLTMGSMVPSSALKPLLMHREKMIESLLKIRDVRLLDETNRQILEG
jgi:hypothetical protein